MAYREETYDRNGNVIDVVEIPYTLAEKKIFLEDSREDMALGGVPFNGMTVDTNEKALTFLLGIRAQALADLNFTIDWDVGDFNFITLDAPTIITIANLAAAHVQKCYTASKAVAPNLADYGTATEILAALQAAYDAL